MATASNTNTLVAVFDDYETAKRAEEELRSSGVTNEGIQVMTADSFRAQTAGSAREVHEGTGIIAWFKRLFGADDETVHGHYAEAIRRGSAVLTVAVADNTIDRARDIIDRYNPIDIDQRVRTWRQQGYSGYDPNSLALTEEERTRERNSAGGDRAIPVVEEELQVGKRAVQRGGVRVYRRVTEQPVEQQVNLREERVRVDRRPVDRPATEADMRPAEQVVEVTEMAEELVVGKRARVTEEVIVGKETRERTETVRDNVLRSDVQVEQLGQGVAEDFRRDYETRYAKAGAGGYDTYAPAYQYGYRMASNPQYRGQKWEDVEEKLRTDYLRNDPNSSWDRIKGSVRYGWEKVTGKRS